MLPPYPELVTKLTTIKRNSSMDRSASNYVQSLLQLPVSDRRYAVDEFGTKCNFYVHDVLHVMDYPVAFMLARQYIDLFRKAGSPLVKMGLQDALTNANMGCPTILGLREPDDKHSHVAVVLPQPPTLKLEDVIISNVGVKNFYGRTMRWAVADRDLHRVEFFGGP